MMQRCRDFIEMAQENRENFWRPFELYVRKEFFNLHIISNCIWKTAPLNLV
jgi:hypothetical protein